MGRFVSFNETAYVADLKKALEGAMERVSRNVFKFMQIRLANLKIRKADAKYKGEIQHAIKMTNKNTTNKLVTHFIGGGDHKPNQSFRAIYYEYGTGTKMTSLNDHAWSPTTDPTWNKNRSGFGAPIYYRKGSWTDLGGNPHKSKYKGGDKIRIDPRKSPVGEEITAQFWFRNSLKAGTRNLDQLVLQAVKSVPIKSYIEIRGMRERM